MNQIVNVSIAQKSFTLELMAYDFLKNYLEDFRTKSSLGIQSSETMDNLEERIAEILSSKVGTIRNVVTLQMVKDLAFQIGMPDGKPYTNNENKETHSDPNRQFVNPPQFNSQKKLYRDPDNRILGGVCGGMGLYFNIDPVIVRVILICLFFGFGTGLMVYLILWILIPKAATPAQKCELRGWPITMENMARFNKQN